MSKEALKACLLPKETRYFISEHGKTKTVKKGATNMAVLEGLPSGGSSESNEVVTEKKKKEKKRRETKRPSITSFLSC